MIGTPRSCLMAWACCLSSCSGTTAPAKDAGAVVADGAFATPDAAADAAVADSADAVADVADVADAQADSGPAEVGPDAAVLDTLTDADAAPDASTPLADSADVPDTADNDSADTDTAGNDSADAPADVDTGLDPPDAGPPDAGTPLVGAAGCADGTREAFLDATKYPLAAACSGAWDIPGIHAGAPACARQAGNTGVNASGKGCNVEDLCATGWHVCYGAKDLKERNPLGCGGILDGGAKSPAFFLARSSSTGAFNCSQDSTKFGGPGTSNDLFGCGDLGCGISLAQYPTCDPLDRASHDLCKGLRNDMGCGDWCAHLGKFPGEKNTWDCGKDGVNEANTVVKTDPATQGGVLCCADFLKGP